jgi:hypothetical protein
MMKATDKNTEHGVRDTKADLHRFTGNERCLEGLALPSGFRDLKFQHWKSITTSTKDTATVGSFISLRTHTGTQDTRTIACIQAILSPAGVYTVELPLALQSRFLVVQLLVNTGINQHYKMPHYTLSDDTMIIQLAVRHSHSRT